MDRILWNAGGYFRVRDRQMRPIRLPEPPGGFSGVPEIFKGGVCGAIRRAVVIGNGFAGAENQSIGLVRALGLSGRQSLCVSTSYWFTFFFFFNRFIFFLSNMKFLIVCEFTALLSCWENVRKCDGFLVYIISEPHCTELFKMQGISNTYKHIWIYVCVLGFLIGIMTKFMRKLLSIWYGSCW